MKWINKLERKFGKYSIKNLMLYIILLTAVVFFLNMIDQSGRFLPNIMLIPERVLRGEIWRLITFIFIPPTRSPIFIIFVLYFYYLIANTLEQRWGSFKFNLYYLTGMLFTIAAVFLFGGRGSSVYINLTLFLAFAKLNPNYEILLFFILPIKMKYLALFNWLYLGFVVLTSPLYLKMYVIMALGNYFLYFGREIIKDSKRKFNNYQRKNKFKSKSTSYNSDTIHKCTICGITEKDNPNEIFRYCTKCDGIHEYCSKHLHNHKHIKKY